MAPEPGVAWACSWTPSGFALCFVDARDENSYDLGSGCTPPRQGVLRRAPGPGFALSDDARDENWHDLGVWVGPSHQMCLGLVPGPPSGFELRFDDACDDNSYDLCVSRPPFSGVLGLLLAPLRICAVFR